MIAFKMRIGIFYSFTASSCRCQKHIRAFTYWHNFFFFFWFNWGLFPYESNLFKHQRFLFLIQLSNLSTQIISVHKKWNKIAFWECDWIQNLHNNNSDATNNRNFILISYTGYYISKKPFFFKIFIHSDSSRVIGALFRNFEISAFLFFFAPYFSKSLLLWSQFS